MPARQWLDFAASAAHRGARNRAGDRLSAHFPKLRDRRRADHSNLALDHAGLLGAPTAVRAALVHGGAAADQHQPRRSGRDAGRQQVALGAASRGAADGWRHSRRVRHQLHHRRGRAFGNHFAGRQGVAGADELRHLPAHAVGVRARRRCCPRRLAGADGRHRTYLSHVLADRANRNLEQVR